MWSSTFGYSASEIGVFASILSASIVGTQYLATRMLLRFGTRMTLAFAELLSVALLGEWLVYPSILALYATAVIFGLSVSTWLPSLSSLFMAVAPVEERGSVAGKLALFRGLVGAPAPFIGGFLFATYGYNVPVTLSMIGEFVAAIAILRLIPK